MRTPKPAVRFWALIIDCRDVKALGGFYQALTGWDVVHEEGDAWYTICSPQGLRVAFQQTPEYAPPVWPGEVGRPGQMMHLDFQAEAHEAAVALALSLGARRASAQFYGEGCVTMIDPEGHPFCILREE